MAVKKSKKTLRRKRKSRGRTRKMKGGALKFESVSAANEDRVVVTVLPDPEEAPIVTSLKRARALFE